MSHVVAIATELTDIEAVKRACAELGLPFKENQKTIKWFGSWMDDYDGENAAYKLGIPPEKYGTCDHAIEIPGSKYTVGLLKTEKSNGYKIYFDYFGKEGRKIQETIGNGGERLLQLYAVHKTSIEAKKKGYLVTRKQVGLKIQMSISGM